MRPILQYLYASVPALLILGAFTYFGNWIPQTRWEPPKQRAITAAMAPAELARTGESIVRERGCMNCHTLERGVGVKGQGRGPNLADIGARTARGVPGGPSTQVEYLAQALYDPGAYLVEGYASIMPPATEAPAKLSYEEAVAVIAYLQSLGGSPKVKVGDVPRPAGAKATAPPGPPTAGAPAGEPAAILEKQGCLACHRVRGQGGNAGPGLDALGAEAGQRVPGLAPDAYLRQAILEPSAYLVKGFPDIMPKDYGSKMTAGELEALVKYLQTLKGG